MNSVEYSLEGRVATIRIDDGKRNALAPIVLRGIYQALDRAEADGATVILTALLCDLFVLPALLVLWGREPKAA